MASIYKKFTAQDFTTTPFNAHKQYTFNSASAVENSVSYFNTRYTSESISLYSSASTNPQGLFDPINAIKYNQINHLYYNRFRSNTSRTFEQVNYLNHHRTLYEKTNILSIPNGLCGYEVKPGSFELSSSIYEVVDDNNGNLIIKGTNVDNYPTDKRQNLFKLEPTKGFEAYDLGVFKGYTVFRYDTEPIDGELVTYYTRKFWRRGEENPNARTHYSTPEGVSDTDDSYYFNNIKYNNIQFEKSTLGDTHHKFPSIFLDSITGSNIMSPHNENLNFNSEDNFSISFYIQPKKITPSIGDDLGGGKVFFIDNNFAYIASPIQTPTEQYGAGVEIGATFTEIGGGLANTNLMKQQLNSPSEANNIASINGYTDWWIANVSESKEIVSKLLPIDPFLLDPNGTPISEVLVTSQEVNQSSFQSLPFAVDPGGIDDFNFIDDNGVAQIGSFSETDPLVNPSSQFTKISFNGLISPQFQPPFATDKGKYFLVRRISRLLDEPGNKNYILSKSTTKTIVPKAFEGKSAIKNTKEEGNMQYLNTQAEPQFPFEIYLQSQHLFFDRSDGESIISLNAHLSSSSHTFLGSHHVLCQKTGSNLEIYVNGNKIVTADDSKLSQTRNLANLYIGSKGEQSIPHNGKQSNIRHFNGTLTNLNIFNKAFTQTEITNISESINASPFIGNIFYRNGFATITHPKYHSILSSSAGAGTINSLKFQGSHLIYEHEYQCPVDEYEFNNTYNISTRKLKSITDPNIANFATGSNFNTFVTTVGLYNDDNELLVVGKLGQPIKISKETDMTFVLRWDT